MLQHHSKQSMQQQQPNEIIRTIKNETLFYRPVLLRGIKAYIKTCHTNFSFQQSEMLTKPQKLKNLIDKGLGHVDFKHICLKQKKTMSRHIVSLQRYEHRYVQPLADPERQCIFNSISFFFFK